MLLPLVEAVAVTAPGRGPLQRKKDQVVALFSAGKTSVEIAKFLGFTVASVRTLLKANGLGLRKQEPEYHHPPLILFPGMQYEISGTRFSLERVTKCRSGPLYLFRSRAGWRESFTLPQMRDAVIKTMGG
jgi:hypothetical protein